MSQFFKSKNFSYSKQTIKQKTNILNVESLYDLFYILNIRFIAKMLNYKIKYHKGSIPVDVYG